MKGSTINAVLTIYNPNPYPLEAQKVSYTVVKISDGTQVADGIISDGFAIPHKNSSDVSIPVHIMYAGVGAAAKSMFRRGATDLKISGHVTVYSQMGSPTVPFSFDRTVNMLPHNQVPVPN